MLQLHPSDIKDVVLNGGVIAYPTEAVYGLGCDPDNDTAIQKLLAVKQRPWQKGLILVASEFSQLLDYVDESQLSAEQLEFAFSKWPGPFTFVMPIKPHVSRYLSGEFDSIAVRVSAHPIVQQLCRAYGKPLVSTSANLSGQPSITDPVELEQSLGSLLSAIMPGALGGATQPSQIRNALTGDIVRS